jgi:tRNA (guanine37-N1)-methyltransferase
MKISILTLFPNMFTGPFDESIIKRAQNYGLVDIETHQLRDWTHDKHQTVDDRPYGGGVGMLMKVEPIARALEELKMINAKLQMPNKDGKERQIADQVRNDLETHLLSTNYKLRTVLLDAGGEKFTQRKAEEYAKLDHLILVCGRYEGVDHRVHEHLVDDIISIGDFVVTGGEIPAMLVVDAVTRLIPNVLEKDTATDFESFSLDNSLLEYPQYTRPEEFNGWKVPKVLLTGDHKKIEEWKKEESIKKTKNVRPDLLK